MLQVAAQKKWMEVLEMLLFLDFSQATHLTSIS